MSEINASTGLPQDSGGMKPYLQMGNAYQTTGVQRTLYQNVDFNMMNWPQNLLYQALASGNLAPAIPNPLTGIKIALPDGDSTVPALGWQSANAVGSGLYRVGTQDFGWAVNSSLVTEWLASEFRVNYLTAGQIVFPDSNKKLTGSASLFWDNTNSFLLTQGTAGKQHRIGYDGSNFTDLLTSSAGIFSIAPSGTRMFMGTDNFNVTTYFCVNGSVNGSLNNIIQNTSAGPGAIAELIVSNTTITSPNPTDSFRFLCMGTGFTTAGGFMQDSGVIDAESGLTGGMNLITRANAPIRFYTNGHTNLRMTLDGSGFLGVNTSGPDRRVDILDASNPQLRLTFTDGSVFTDFKTDSAGSLVINTSGTISAYQVSSAGNQVRWLVDQTDNTNAASDAIMWLRCGGSSAGDPAMRFSLQGVGNGWMCGLDNSNSDAFVLSRSITALGSSDVLVISATGGLSHTTVSGANEWAINDNQTDCDFRVEGDSISHLLFCDATATTENIACFAAAAPNWQTMDRGFFIGNTSTAPTGNPASGHFYYDNAGTPTWRSSGGAIMNLSQATGGENVTNSVTDTASTNGTIPDITNGVAYATDYTNLRNALFQLARMLKQDHDQLRAMGILT